MALLRFISALWIELFSLQCITAEEIACYNSFFMLKKLWYNNVSRYMYFIVLQIYVLYAVYICFIWSWKIQFGKLVYNKVDIDNINKVNQSDSMFSVKGNFYKKKYQYLCICLFPEISAVIIRVCKIWCILSQTVKQRSTVKM